jgi:hypothetical protein
MRSEFYIPGALGVLPYNPIRVPRPMFFPALDEYLEIFEEAVNAFEPKLPLYNFMRSEAGQIVTLANLYCYCRRPATYPNTRVLISVMFGSEVTWEDVGRMYRKDISRIAETIRFIYYFLSCFMLLILGSFTGE